MPLLALLAAAVVAQTPPPLCAPLPGAAAVMAAPALARVIVQTVAGTLELPALFGDLVCAAAERRGPLVVALDYPAAEQGELGAFLVSDGGPAATQRFLAQRRWAQLDQDGRASVGDFRLLDRLRRLMADGKVAQVVPISAPAPLDGRSLRLELEEGEPRFGALAAPASADPRTLRLIATFDGGRAWNCDPTCGYHPLAPTGTEPRGVTPAPDGGAGTLSLGAPVAAALPAARFAERERIRQAGAWGFFDDLFP